MRQPDVSAPTAARRDRVSLAERAQTATDRAPHFAHFGECNLARTFELRAPDPRWRSAPRQRAGKLFRRRTPKAFPEPLARIWAAGLSRLGDAACIPDERKIQLCRLALVAETVDPQTRPHLRAELMSACSR